MNQTNQQRTEDIDWDGVTGEAQEFTDIFPRLQWNHGKRQMKQVGGMVYTGGLFLPQKEYSSFEDNLPEGWQQDSFIPQGDNAQEIYGWSTTKAHLSVIRMKKWWGNNNDSHVHILCTIKDVDGLFCVQVGGLSKGKAFEDAFQDHRKQIVSLANKSRPQGTNPIEPLGLYFVVAPAPHSMIRSSKKDAESEVTLPVLYLPESGVSLEYVRTLYVGKKVYAQNVEYYQETKGWQNQIPKPVAPQEDYVSTFQRDVADDNAEPYAGQF